MNHAQDLDPAVSSKRVPVALAALIRPGVGRRSWARTAIPAVDSAADKRDDGRREALHTTEPDCTAELGPGARPGARKAMHWAVRTGWGE